VFSPFATRYTSEEESREAGGETVRRYSNSARTSSRKASRSSPWKAFTTKSPPGASSSSATSNACRARWIDRAWSREYSPVMFGAMSESTTSAPRSPTASRR
jgi:hypothetical protein